MKNKPSLEEKINAYPTKYKEGFTEDEIEKLLKQYPDLNLDRFNKELVGVTGKMVENNPVIYHCDILTALRCGLENRGMYQHEWD